MEHLSDEIQKIESIIAKQKEITNALNELEQIFTNHYASSEKPEVRNKRKALFQKTLNNLNKIRKGWEASVISIIDNNSRLHEEISNFGIA